MIHIKNMAVENLGLPQIPQMGVILKSPFDNLETRLTTKLGAIISLLTKAGKPRKFRNWEVTFHGYEAYLPRLLGLKIMREAKYIMNHEKCPTTGRLHYQAHISLKEGIPMDQAKVLFENMHKEPTKALKSAVEYCSKPESIDLSQPRLINGYEDSNDVNPNPIDEHGPRKWQKRVIEMCQEPPHRRIIHWFWSVHGGIGKSDLVAWLEDNMDAIAIDKGTGNDMRCYVSNHLTGGELKSTTKAKKMPIFILDLPKKMGNKCDYLTLEAIKNGRLFSGKYVPGKRKFKTPHVLVFANSPPKEDDVSDDRWHIVQVPSKIIGRKEFDDSMFYEDDDHV